MKGSLQGRPGNPVVPGPGGELYQGFRLRQLRTEAGKTLDEVGEAIGITGSALGNIENNRAKPAKATLERLATFYDVDPTDILDAPIHPQLRRKKQLPTAPSTPLSLAALHYTSSSENGDRRRQRQELVSALHDILMLADNESAVSSASWNETVNLLTSYFEFLNYRLTTQPNRNQPRRETT